MATSLHPQPSIEWHTGMPPLDRFLRWAWSSRARQPDAMLIVAGVSGLLTGLVMPRGPVTTWQALFLIVVAALTGALSGLTLGSRWAMLLAPIAHLIAFEITRIGQSGLTVDSINLHLGDGLIEFVVGRGFYAFLILLPMIVGVAWGAAYIRDLAGTEQPGSLIGSIASGIVTGASVLLVIGMAIRIIIPAYVPGVTDARGQHVPGSTAELRQVEIGGTEQWIEIRAASEDLPVLLYLPPVPGLGTMPAARELLDPLTASFVVVTWDMRGSGKSYPSFDPDTLTVDRLVADIIEMTNYLRKEFDEDKVYLVAQGWGTLFTVLAAQQHPELFYAIVNSNQMVAPALSDRQMYRTLLAWATNWYPYTNQEDISTIEGYGYPPYDDFRTYQEVTRRYGHVAGVGEPPGVYWSPGTAWFGWESIGMDGPEYTYIDRINAVRSRSDVFATLYPELQEIDLRTDVPTLDVPIYILDEQQTFHHFGYGTHPLPGTLDLMLEWFDALDAPSKQWDKGVPLRSGQLKELMVKTVLPATYPGRQP